MDKPKPGDSRLALGAWKPAPDAGFNILTATAATESLWRRTAKPHLNRGAVQIPAQNPFSIPGYLCAHSNHTHKFVEYIRILQMGRRKFTDDGATLNEQNA